MRGVQRPAENTRDLLNMLGIGIAKLAVREVKPEARSCGTEVTVDPRRAWNEFETILAEREGFEPSVQENLHAGFRILCDLCATREAPP